MNLENKMHINLHEHNIARQMRRETSFSLPYRQPIFHSKTYQSSTKHKTLRHCNIAVLNTISHKHYFRKISINSVTGKERIDYQENYPAIETSTNFLDFRSEITLAVHLN
jgi:hypothetical protein